MNTVAIAFFLISLLGSVQSKSDPVDSDIADLKAALDFIKCAQEAITTGIPEADIPSHDPLIIPHNISYNVNVSGTTLTVHLDNMVIEGLPWWNVTEAAQDVSDDPNVDIFMFIIYWPMMRLSADWGYEAESLSETSQNNGTISIELDHVNFTMLWISTKPTSEKNGTLDEFTLDIAPKEAKVHVTNLGVYGEVINAVGGRAIVGLLKYLNPLPDVINEQLKKRLIDEWVEKPERIAAVNANCNK